MACSRHRRDLWRQMDMSCDLTKVFSICRYLIKLFAFGANFSSIIDAMMPNS